MKIQKSRRTNLDFLDSNVSSFDYETTGLSTFNDAEIFSYCIGWPIFNKKHEMIAAEVEVKRLDTPSSAVNAANLQYLKDYWKNTSVKKIIHNAKFELHFTKAANIYIPDNTIIHDTMIMSQLLRNLNPSHALDYLAWELAGYSRELDERVKAAFKSYGNYQKIPEYLMHPYQVADGERPLLLYFTMIESLRKDKLLYQDYLNEIEVIKATQIEEQNGLMIHTKNITRLRSWLENELDKIAFDTYKLMNEYVNLNSPPQVSRLLYKKLGFGIMRFIKDSYPPSPATDKDALFELNRIHKHPIFDLIFKQRSYQKALTVLKGYVNFADANLKVHTNLNTNSTNTGRKSSSRPQLHNVNNEKALKNPFPVALRKCFRPEKGYVLIPVDYSGIQMRLVIGDCKEPELYSMLQKNPDADTHHPTVECFLMDGIFKKKGDKIFKSGIKIAKDLLLNDSKRYNVVRKAYKSTGFSVAFGGGLWSVAEINMKTVEEITTGYYNYINRFERIANFSQSKEEEVKEKGYIITKFGRKLYVPRDRAYMGVNYFAQGTEAGILKRAHVRLQRLLSNTPAYKGITIVLDVHDELLFQYPRTLLKYKEEILPVFYHTMVDMPEIEIKLRCEFSICTNNWNDKKDLIVTL